MIRVVMVGAILVVCMLLMLTSGIWVALTLTGLAIIGLSLIENSSIGPARHFILERNHRLVADRATAVHLDG